MPLTRQIGHSASEDRLEKLIEERLQRGSDKVGIDKRIWDLFGEEWAVMFTDLSGFSRGVEEFGIVHFLQTIYESQRLLIPCIDNYDGILLKVEADSLLVIFRRPEKAVDCAISDNMAAGEESCPVVHRKWNQDSWQRRCDHDLSQLIYSQRVGHDQNQRCGKHEIATA